MKSRKEKRYKQMAEQVIMEAASEKDTNILISNSVVDLLPTIVKRELVKMDFQEQEMFMEEYKRKSKSKGTAYLLLLVGFHYAYVKEWGLQCVYFLTVYGLFIWLIVDIFRMPSIIKSYNQDVSIEILRSMKAISK